MTSPKSNSSPCPPCPPPPPLPAACAPMVCAAARVCPAVATSVPPAWLSSSAAAGAAVVGGVRGGRAVDIRAVAIRAVAIRAVAGPDLQRSTRTARPRHARPDHSAPPTRVALEAEGVVVGAEQPVGGSGLGALLVALLEDEGLGQQHAGDGQEGDEHQEELQPPLPAEHLVLGALAAAVDVAGLRRREASSRRGAWIRNKMGRRGAAVSWGAAAGSRGVGAGQQARLAGSSSCSATPSPPTHAPTHPPTQAFTHPPTQFSSPPAHTHTHTH